MSRRCPQRRIWRAWIAGAALAGEHLRLGAIDCDMIAEGLPYPQVLALFDGRPVTLTPNQVCFLDQLADLDNRPDGRLYRWVWRHCWWPFGWQVPPRASTRALSRASIQAGVSEVAGTTGDAVSRLAELEAVELRWLPGLPRVVLTIAPGVLGFDTVPDATPAGHGSVDA